jgi:rubrerythrin
LIAEAREILETAKEMERAGASFYRQLEEKHGGDDSLRELFGFLASEEDGHLREFEKLLDEIPDFSFPEHFAPMARDLKGFASIFSSSRLADERRSLSSLLTAVDFAIRREMDTIFFYDELLAMVPDLQQKWVRSLIEQERRHFRELTELRAHIAR